MYRDIASLSNNLRRRDTERDKSFDWRKVNAPNTPSKFGPPYWFTFHTAALNYPYQANRFAQTHMKNLIYAIPMIVPCVACAEHAKQFIASQDIDDAVLGRQNIFTFFWKFHNYVNKRLGKNIISLENALEIYGTPLNTF